MSTLRLEAPTGQTLKAYLFPYTTEVAADVAGYSLTETASRQYEVTLSGLVGTYRVVVEVITDAITTTIDSGYVLLEAAEGTYLMTNGLSITPTVAVVSSASDLPDYGPRRVKTKELEIEQFDPLKNQMAQERSILTQPSWCEGYSCVGKNKCP